MTEHEAAIEDHGARRQVQLRPRASTTAKGADDPMRTDGCACEEHAHGPRLRVRCASPGSSGRGSARSRSRDARSPPRPTGSGRRRGPSRARRAGRRCRRSPRRGRERGGGDAIQTLMRRAGGSVVDSSRAAATPTVGRGRLLRHALLRGADAAAAALRDELGLGKTGAGVLAAAYPAGVLVGAIPSGIVAARLGVKPTVIVGLTASPSARSSSGSPSAPGSSTRRGSSRGSRARSRGRARSPGSSPPRRPGGAGR